MTELAQLQERFMAYVQHASDGIGADIHAVSNDERSRRLSIYYNAYRIRLRGSIEVDHPALGIYLGDEGFERMATAYIDSHPSTYTSLRHFCDQLPKFLRRNRPFSDIGILSHLAEFERLLMDVFDAADSSPANFDALSTLPVERWPSLKFELHPSVRLYVTAWNSVEIWRAIKSEQRPPEAARSDSQAWLLWRNTDRLTEFRSLNIEEYTALSHAQHGQTFAALCESQMEWATDDEIAGRVLGLLRKWFDAGLIVHAG